MRHRVLAALLIVATTAAVYSDAVLADVVFVKKKPDDAVWTPRETPLLDEHPLLTRLPADQRSRYGGWITRRFDASGFFRTEKQDGNWWLVDPDGYAFFSVGLNAVEPGVESTAPEPELAARFDDAFASVDAWANITGDWLAANGFNSLGSWSDWRQLNAGSEQAVPYTVQLHLLSRFVWQEKKVHMGGDFQPRWTHYYLLDPDFPAYCKKRLAEIAPRTRDDRYLIGYFTDNELGLRANQLDLFLGLDVADPVRRQVAAWLTAERGHQSQRDGGFDIDDGDRLSFLRYLAETYYRIVAEAVRTADPNHLILGDRTNWDQRYIRDLWEAAVPFVDVFSFNWYDIWNPDDHAEIGNWARWVDRPVMITEWYAKGMDSGLANESGAGWIVRDQEARGKFYEAFALGLLDEPNIVGFHWFRYRDNNPDAGAYVDPSNVDSNKGMVDVDYRPWSALVTRAKRINDRVYGIRKKLLRRQRAGGDE